MGLILLVKAFDNDNFYKFKPLKGFTILINNPLEFPDSTGGGIVEVPVNYKRETFLRVDSVSMVSEPKLAYYSRETRKCAFAGEYGKKYGDTYTRGQCITLCKLKSVQALCECIPFQLPHDHFPLDNFTSTPTCNLGHVNCLNKYKVKWLTITTELLNVQGLEREREESVFCPDCLQACDDTKYRVISTSLPLRQRNPVGSIMDGIKNVSELSLIRVFYGQPESLKFNQGMQMEWFEMLSSFGGIFGILLGFSLVTATEFVFFVVSEVCLFVREKWNMKMDQKANFFLIP